MYFELTLVGAAASGTLVERRGPRVLGSRIVSRDGNQVGLVVSGPRIRLRNEHPLVVKSSEKPVRWRRLIKDVVQLFRERDLSVPANDKLSTEIQNIGTNVNRGLLLSGAAVTSVLLAPFSPVFSLIGAAGVLFLSKGIFRYVWRDLREGRYLSVFVVDAILVLGMIAVHQLLLAAMAGLLGRAFMKVIALTEDRSEKGLTSAFENQPSEVWVLKDGVELLVRFDSVKKGDLVIVKTGEIIPVDGFVESGAGTVDERLLTGEGYPVEKSAADPVFASTALLSGQVSIRVKTAGSETVSAKIGGVLEKTQSYKNTLMARGEKIANRFLPIQAGISGLTWLLLGPAAALTVLWASLGGNMIVLGPLSVLGYLQIYSRRGILIKDGRVLESLQQVDTVVFDKTGTLTLDQPEVSNIHCFGGYTENQLLGLAASAEGRQNHPIARAIVEAAQGRGIELLDVDESSYEVGLGVSAEIQGERLQLGSERFLVEAGIEWNETTSEIKANASQDGATLLFVAVNERLAGVIELRSQLRPEAHEVVTMCQKRGITPYIISGDQEQPTRYIAAALGIENYHAEVLPQDKAGWVKNLTEAGKFVCFIGDGVNDAIALKSAQVSISLQGASNAAVDTAEVVMLDGTLKHIPQLFRYADEFEGTMKKNLLASVVPGVLCIGGVFFLHLGLVAGMTIYYLGSVVGLSNALLPLAKHQLTSPGKTTVRALLESPPSQESVSARKGGAESLDE